MTAPLFVLGATGQIGDRLGRRLAGAGRPALLLARRIPQAPGGFEWREADLGERVAFPPLPPVGIATVPLWLLPPHLEALQAAGLRRLVAFSTTSIFGKATTRSAVERRQIDAVLAAEAALQGASIGVTLLRPALIYGAGRDAGVTAAARFIARFGCYPLWGPAAGLRQPVHADDLAAAALAAADRPDLAGQAFNLGGGEMLGYREMIGRIFDALGRRRRLVPVPGLPWLAAAYGRFGGPATLTADAVRRMSHDLAFDDGAAGRAFGYAPRRFLASGVNDLVFPPAQIVNEMYS
ncbi:NAD-dependent epimerase/dehydratase family protein [Desertibaculum subflavum]|uniref:NAD-dependent epimerase/dehydratase family protein n=1 Tax=Desertibaculum subflavum TaxID=2268458 RepID=UPI000E661FB5